MMMITIIITIIVCLLRGRRRGSASPRRPSSENTICDVKHKITLQELIRKYNPRVQKINPSQKLLTLDIFAIFWSI